MQEEQQQQMEGMASDELSMKRSSDFFNALQELKNLRPQFYHAADYCEKSYLVDQYKRNHKGHVWSRLEEEPKSLSSSEDQ
ncbi:hypothetical protein KI387_025321, partial [Taxus chinensis]